MKIEKGRRLILVSFIAILLLGACASQSDEAELDVETPDETVQGCESGGEVTSADAIILEHNAAATESCVSPESPAQSFVYSTSAICATEIIFSVDSSESGLGVSLIDPSNETVLDTADGSSGDVSFDLPPDAKNAAQANFFQMDVGLDSDASSKQSFSVKVIDICEEAMSTINDLGPAPDIGDLFTFSTDSDLWTVRLPAGWSVDVGEGGVLNLANDAALLSAVNRPDFAIAAEQIGLTLIFVPGEMPAEVQGEGAYIAELAAYLALAMVPVSDDIEVSFGAVDLVQHEGEVVLARAPYSYGSLFAGMTVVWEISEDAFGVTLLMVPPGETALAENFVYAIIESVEFSAPLDEILASF